MTRWATSPLYIKSPAPARLRASSAGKPRAEGVPRHQRPIGERVEGDIAAQGSSPR